MTKLSYIYFTKPRIPAKSLVIAKRYSKNKQCTLKTVQKRIKFVFMISILYTLHIKMIMYLLYLAK